MLRTRWNKISILSFKNIKNTLQSLGLQLLFGRIVSTIIHIKIPASRMLNLPGQWSHSHSLETGIKNSSHTLSKTNTHTSTSSSPTNFPLLSNFWISETKECWEQKGSIWFYENSNYLPFPIKVGIRNLKNAKNIWLKNMPTLKKNPILVLKWLKYISKKTVSRFNLIKFSLVSRHFDKWTLKDIHLL